MSEETKHTPGPWSIKLPIIYAPALGLRVGKVGAVSIAYKDTPTFEANARLIAAAPELLEALEGLWMWCRNWDCEFMDDDEFPEYRARIEAAIAKARGEA